jgi:photosystem II stability/assembly factor-like uncharacterized protein
MKINLIILFLIFTSFLKAEEPFWEYIGGPIGGECQNLVYNEEKKIYYLTTTNGIFRSVDQGLNWERTYFNKDTKKYTINQFGNFFEVTNSNEVFFYNSQLNERKIIKGLKLKNAFSQRLSVKIDGNDNCFIIDQTEQNDYLFFLYLINPNISKIDSLKIKRQDLDSNKSLNYYVNDIKVEDSSLSITVIVSGTQVEFSLILKYDFHLNLISKIYAPQVWQIEYINKNIIGTIVHKGETYLSTDSGKTWLLIFYKTGIFSKYKDKLYFFSYLRNYNDYSKDSIYVSTDSGLTWENLGFNSDIMNEVIVIDSGKYLGINDRSVYNFDNNLKIWARSDHGLKASKLNDISYSKNGDIYSVYFGVQKSTDNGNTWEFLGLDDQLLYHILITDNGYIFVSGASSGFYRGNMFRSKDSGRTWEWLGNLFGTSTYGVSSIYQNKRGHIFASTYGVGGYFYSTDYGDTWNYKSTGGGSNCFSANSEDHIFTGYYAGIVFRSTDDGDTWEQMTEYFSGDNCFWDITNIAFDPKGGNGYSFCLKTTDNGRTWIQDSETPPDYSFCFDSLGNYFRFRRETNAVYQVYRSTNKGLDWVNISSGIEHNNYNILSVSPGGYYFLGAEYGGLYRSKQKYVSVEENQQKTETIVYPNPTNNLLYLKLEGESQIFIYNLLGQLELNIMESDNQYVDVSALDEGMYIIKIKSGLNIKTEKFIINR